MKKNTFITSLTFILFVIQCLHSQTNVTFVNTGQMNVAAASPSTRVSLYVPDAMRQLGSGVQVRHARKTIKYKHSRQLSRNEYRCERFNFWYLLDTIKR